MRKHGRTKTGRQRWRCTDCNLTTTIDREDLTRKADFALFLDYVTGKDSQSQMDGTATGRSLRRRINWCWDVPVPTPPATGEVYDQVFLDGKRMPYNWVLLTATNQAGKVVAWQWATNETAAAYTSLLEGIAPPTVVTVDGAKGGLKAIKALWETEGTRVQRCLLHVHRNNTQDLTSRPKTPAGKTLKHLSHALLHITSPGEATAWEQALQGFHDHYGDYLKERTLAKDNPEMARIKRRQWWYTHDRDRRVHFRLARLVRAGVLFTYLTANPGQILHSTTNIAESLNALIDAVLYQHRGLSETHMIQAVQWLLYTRTEDPLPPQEILKQWDQAGQPKTRVLPPKQPKPPQPTGPKQVRQPQHPRRRTLGQKRMGRTLETLTTHRHPNKDTNTGRHPPSTRHHDHKSPARTPRAGHTHHGPPSNPKTPPPSKPTTDNTRRRTGQSQVFRPARCTQVI